MKNEDLTHKIISCTIKVHCTLENGFQEDIYQRALAIETEKQNLIQEKVILMTKNRAEVKEQINSLSRNELADIVIKLSAKKDIYDFLQVNYFDKQSGEKELFDEAKTDISRLSCKRYKGFSEQLRMANMLGACIKRVNEFTKISKNKKLEADLVLYVLEIPFAYPANMFGTCFTAYDYKVGLLLKRLITLVTKKLHDDYRVEYTDTINQYLAILHRTSDHIDTIFNLPHSI